MIDDRIRVLLLDDEESLREPLGKHLREKYGYCVDGAADSSEALTLLVTAQGQYDVALIDQLLCDGPDGIEVMHDIKRRYPNIECIIFTGWGTDHRQRALTAGAFRHIQKPFDVAELAMLIRTAAQQVRLRTIGRAILCEHNLDRVLDAIVSAACSLALADDAAISLLDRVSDEVKLHAKTSRVVREWRRHFEGRELSREIIKTENIEHVADAAHDDRVNRKVVDSGVGSFLGIPIPGEDGSLGVLYVYSRRSHHFDAWGTVAVLQTLAEQAGLAIANAEAFQQLQLHGRYMEALVRTGESLAHATSLPQQLDTALQFALEQLQVATFIVALYDKARDIISFPLFYDQSEYRTVQDAVLGSDSTQWGITGHVIRTGRELFWTTTEEKSRACVSLNIRPKQLGQPCQTCFYFPLRRGNEIIGAVSVQSYRPHAFAPIVLDAVRALGNHLLVALENRRLIDRTQHWAADLGRLQEISATITSSLELQQVQERTCQAAVEFFGADHSGLVIFDEDLKYGRVVAEYPSSLGTKGTTIPIMGVIPEERLANDGDPLIVEDMSAAESLGPVRDILHGRFNIVSILIVPIMCKGQRVGTFSLDTVSRSRCFSDQEVDLCRIFANQVGIAIDNARTFEETRFRRQLLADLDKASLELRSIKEPVNLEQELTRLAAELVQYQVACLFTNYPQLGELELVASHPLDRTMVTQRLSHADNVVGAAARSGQKQLGDRPPECMGHKDILRGKELIPVIALPLKQVAR